MVQNDKTQSVNFHVSCSKRLEIGDQFGSLMLIDSQAGNPCTPLY